MKASSAVKPLRHSVCLLTRPGMDVTITILTPVHQRTIRYSLYILGGFYAGGTFLDSVSNAISLITFSYALWGSASIAICDYDTSPFRGSQAR